MMPESEGKMQELATSTALAETNIDAANKIYSTLKENEIRIVRLHHWRSSVDDPIACSLITTSIHSTHSYETLSYTWGTTIQQKPITLDGIPFAVTENLYAALKSLRGRDTDRLIWVDALAINQVDIPERNSAIRRMREIYAYAQETMVWLGPDLQKQRNLFQVIEKFKDENRVLGCEACLSKPFHHFDQLAKLWKSDRLDFREELREFCYVEYWRRVWVVQEMLYSQKATLYCGPDKLSMDIFRPFWLALDKVTKDRTNPKHAAYQTYILARIPNQAIQFGFKPEDKIFSYDVWARDFCTQRACTDPRDLVFGFYHCFPPEVQKRIRVDYSKLDHEVFRDITRAYMESEKRLLCFKHVERFSRLDESVAYPSWTPTYHNQSLFVPYHENLCKSYPTEFYFEGNGSCLCVRGVCIGMIQLRYSLLSSEMAELIDNELLEARTSRSGKWMKFFNRWWIELGIPWDWAIEFVLAKTTYRFNDDRMERIGLDRLRDLISRISKLTGDESESEIEKQLGHQRDRELTSLWRLILDAYFDNSQYIAATVYKSNGIGIELGFPHRIEDASNLAVGNPKIEAGDEVCVIRGYDCPIILRRKGDSYIFIGNTVVYGMKEKYIWDRFYALDDSKLETFRIV